MNFETDNQEIYQAMEDVFGNLPNNSKINFAADYSQNRKLTAVNVQVENAPYVHGLIFIYSRSIALFDVLKYRNRTVYRQGQLGKLTPQINLINKFILKHIPHMNQLSQRKIKEDVAEDKEDFKIDNLKNQIEQLKNKNRSYRDEIQNLKDRIVLINKNNP